MNPGANTREVLYEKYDSNKSIRNFIGSMMDGVDVFKFHKQHYYIKDNNVIIKLIFYYPISSFWYETRKKNYKIKCVKKLMILELIYMQKLHSVLMVILILLD